MASLSLYPQFETNLMSNPKVIEFLLQLKSTKAHGKNYIKVKPHLVRHLLRNCLLCMFFYLFNLVYSRIPLKHKACSPEGPCKKLQNVLNIKKTMLVTLGSY